jgi:hypothetical protein
MSEMGLAERSERAAPAALSPPAESRINAPVSGSPRAPSCDFCRGALPRGERNRLVWESEALATELILAEVCGHCADKAFGSAPGSQPARLDSVRLVQEVQSSAAASKVVGFIARGVSYVLIALAFFLIVTLISSYAH